jgi:hypothetical protein
VNCLDDLKFSQVESIKSNILKSSHAMNIKPALLSAFAYIRDFVSLANYVAVNNIDNIRLIVLPFGPFDGGC